MAFSTSSRHSNYPGQSVPQVAGDFDKFEMNSSPKWAIGTKIETNDGKVFRYAHFGDDTTQSLVVAQNFSDSGVAQTDSAVIAPASAIAVADESIKPGALGSRYLQFTLASASANQYAGATLVIGNGTGVGYTYDIIGNTPTGNPASGDIRIELAQKLQVALDTTSDVSMMGNPCATLIGASAATDSVVVGVSCSNMDISEAAYGWIQTRGMCSVLTDGTVALGDELTLSDGTTGGAQTADAWTEPVIGFVADVGASGEYSHVYLRID